MTDEVGAGSEQLTTQHNLAEDACEEISVLIALSQHFIIFTSLPCIGIPAKTPAASAKTINNEVIRFFILGDNYILVKLKLSILL